MIVAIAFPALRLKIILCFLNLSKCLASFPHLPFLSLLTVPVHLLFLIGHFVEFDFCNKLFIICLCFGMGVEMLMALILPICLATI